MTLTPFSRSQEGSDCWKMAFLHPISWKNGWILTKFGQLYCCDMKKNWLDFGDLDPIFKITQGLRLLENGLSAPYLMKEWTDFDFCDLDPIFKVTGGLRLLENGFSAPSLQNEWMDYDQTCTAILLRQGQELIRFWWPWPHFQGHMGAQIDGKWLVCTLSPEWMEGFWLNLYIYIVVTWKRTDYILVTLTPFSRSHKGLDCWKMACLHPILKE